MGEIFRTCPDRPWDSPSLLYNGYRVFPGGKERPGRDADPSPLLVPWSLKGRAIPLLPLWAVRPVQSVSACTRVHFTFTAQTETTLFLCFCVEAIDCYWTYLPRAVQSTSKFEFQCVQITSFFSFEVSGQRAWFDSQSLCCRR